LPSRRLYIKLNMETLPGNRRILTTLSISSLAAATKKMKMMKKTTSPRDLREDLKESSSVTSPRTRRAVKNRAKARKASLKTKSQTKK